MFSNSRTFTVLSLTIAIACLVVIGGGSLTYGGNKSAEKATADAAAKESAKLEALEKDVTQGALRIVRPDGQVVECPLKHTDVRADISGFIARVKVTQTFHNPTKEKIEAVYVFPLPHESAVDDMTMVIGERKIVGVIKRRAEARMIYEQALLQGQTAALLEQERPNIFTQSVGNIGPGEVVKVEIWYVDVLRYDVGNYEFHFPMVVGPRYNPGAAIASPTPTPQELSGKVSPPQPDTNRVPDASRISPPVLKPNHRNGHDVMVRVNLAAGVPIQNLGSTNHQAKITRDGDRRGTIELTSGDTIPNKDFVLRYGVVGQKPEMAVLAHTGKYSGDSRTLGEGYFMLMIQPKEDERLTKSPPREIVFLVDVSGSMSGEPIAKASACMREMAKMCRPEKDTMQVITFAGHASKLFEKAVPSTEANIQKAVAFAEAMQGSGGTEMLKGVKAAIDDPLDKERVRIVVMLTDGYIGNEAEIIEHVGKHCGDQVRFWAVGIGQAPNMFLVDGVAKQGGGMGKKLGLRDDTDSLAQEVMTRIQRAQLAKVKINWGGLDVVETYPAKIPELWAGRPVILFGRYRGAGDAAVNVSGVVEGESVSWPLQVKLPESETANEVLAKVWARQKVEDLMQQSFYAGSPEVEEVVTALALDYKLMSQYTSFVAVDSKKSVESAELGMPPRRMLVPVPLPEGTRWEGFFGTSGEGDADSPAEEGAVLRLGLGVKKEAERLSRFDSFYSGDIAGRGGARGRSYSRRAGAPIDERRARGESFAMRPQSARVVRRPMALSKSITMSAPAAGTVGQTVRLQAGMAAGGLGYGGSFGGGERAKLSVKNGLDRAITRARFLSDQEGKNEGIEIGNAVDYTQQSLQANLDLVVQAGKKALDAANEAQKSGDLGVARELFTTAYFLYQSAANRGYGGNEVAGALASLEELRTNQVKAWSKEVPALNKRLELVLRDQSLEDAIAQIAKAAGLSIKLVPGSTADAAALTGVNEPRVTYLDLRHATVAEALDWLLQPERLNWWTTKDGIAVGSERRRGTTAPWVYDVSLIALPDGAELQKLGDWQKSVEAAQKDAEKFVTAIRTELRASDGDQSIVWFAPGQLLVIGTSSQHDKAANLFANLADGKGKLTGAAAELQKLTATRYAERKVQAERSEKASALLRTAAVHQQYGWQLLAAAASGKLDMEALTELQIAWKRPETAELLNGDGRAIVLRSWWVISESQAALGDNERELASLAQLARERTKQSVQDSVSALEKKPDDAEAFASMLYAALAMRDKEFTAKILPLLTKSTGKDDALSAVRTIAKGLIGDREEIDTSMLAKVINDGVDGEDLTVLLAIACKRTSTETWNAFRAAARELVGEQPLDGSVVVLVNRLGNGQLPLAAQR